MLDLLVQTDAVEIGFCGWRSCVVTRGKSWSANEERGLKELLDLGYPLSEIAVKMGKTVESVRQKVRKLGLKVSGGAVGTSSGVYGGSPAEGLPTMLEVMRELWEATRAYKKPVLSRLEVQRLHGLIQGLIAYKEMLENFPGYRKGEKGLVELRRDLDEAIEKEKRQHRGFGSDGAQS